MKKGSITVFLSLILTLLFSFLLTTLEAARIRGAMAYASMITDLAGESFLASYYYPLFQNYRLFGVNAGNEEGFLSEDALLEDIRKDVMYGLEGQVGGLMEFCNTEVELSGYQTLLSKGEEEFLTQIRQQSALDGTTLLLSELFSEEQFTEAGTVGEVYLRQEEALAVTANVAKELLQLMEQVDGIRMGSNGIVFDGSGKIQARDAFVKQIIPMEQHSIRESYGNEEVFSAVADRFYRVDKAADSVLDYLEEIAKLNNKINQSGQKVAEYQRNLEALGKQMKAEEERLSQSNNTDATTLWEMQKAAERISSALGQEQKELEECQNQKKSFLEVAAREYKLIAQKIRGVTSVIKQSLDTVEILEEKQNRAKLVVGAYENFLQGMETKLSKEVYGVFVKELERMKEYAGLEEQGISVGIIRQSLSENYDILLSFSLEGFTEQRLGKVGEEMAAVVQGMKEYTTKGLWFTYGDIMVEKSTWENVVRGLGGLLATGMLSLVGISKEEVSECELSGQELPSAGCSGSSVFEEVMACIEEVTGLLQNGMGKILQVAGNTALDETALELYTTKYFHSYGEESPYTRLKYEREYLIFGAEKDKTNLLTVVLHLVAIRTLLCMVMILKQPDRMRDLEILGAGAVGFTGMPVLASVVKYGVMLLWAVEEALIEVSALLQGKRIPPVGTGTVDVGELFLVNKEMIAQKAEQLPDGIGAKYSDYLVLLSLSKKTRDKAYRAMDLIQENIRYRYNDGFRIRNVITELTFIVKTETTALFDTGVFPKNAYTITCYEKRAY